MEELEASECWALLRKAKVGRLAVDIAGYPDIFPINHIVDNDSIVFRTAPGTKLAGAVLGRSVAFEIDGYEPDTGVAWSVVVKGPAHEIEQMYDYVAALELPLFTWHAAPKPNFVRIQPEFVTGRLFTVVESEAG
jgi:nitroimidazol reductase NimA-like FMN-containing flavoprotein (pyridoxamine 5'-phosphate oxidase superfamily)